MRTCALTRSALTPQVLHATAPAARVMGVAAPAPDVLSREFNSGKRRFRTDDCTSPRRALLQALHALRARAAAVKAGLSKGRGGWHPRRMASATTVSSTLVLLLLLRLAPHAHAQNTRQ